MVSSTGRRRSFRGKRVGLSNKRTHKGTAYLPTGSGNRGKAALWKRTDFTSKQTLAVHREVFSCRTQCHFASFPHFIFFHLPPDHFIRNLFSPPQSLGGKELLICKSSDLWKDWDACLSPLNPMSWVDTHMHTWAYRAVNPGGIGAGSEPRMRTEWKGLVQGAS